MAQYHDNLELVGARITGAQSPVAADEVATKAYVDSAIEGLAWKDSCRVATQASVNLASPGASLDGIALALNDRVLVRAQSTAAENGIYIWNGAAVAMARALDANTAAELEQACTTVEEGTSAGVTFRQSAVNFTLGSGAVTWATFGTSTPVASTTQSGTVELATQAEVDAATAGALAVTPETLGAWGGRARRFSAAIGDGSATQFTLNHNFATDDVIVQVRRTASPKDTILCGIERPTANQVRLTFVQAPALNAFTVVVLA